ncbi:MAG: BON domain-containing protein [Burkholderiales bacterium]|nr:BON domain-containing protein [Burkholderiales bacterium]
MYKSAISTVLIVSISGLLHGCLGPAVVSAGIGATMMVEDPRTAGTIVDDRIIVSKLSARIKDKYPDQAKVHVTSYNNVVLLTGQVKSEAVKDDLQLMVLETQSVRDFKDETTIGEFSTLKGFAKDGAIKTQVVSLLTRSKDVRIVRVSTTVESGAVYLMGLVTQDEGETAAQIAASVKNVSKVVKIFEYVD